MNVTLGWPHKDLNPNARINRMQLANLKRAAKTAAFFTCRQQGLRPVEWNGAHLDITFYPPDRRKRDLDNMLAASKSFLDGVSQAIGVDDSKWSLGLLRGNTCDGGAIEIVITEGERICLGR